MLESQLRDLEWLGLDWDGPMLLQSSGIERLVSAIDKLVERGLAYACVCTRADIRAAQSAPQQGDQELRYPGTCRGRFDSLEQAERQTGLPAALRLRVPEGEVEIADAFAGSQRFDVAREVGDFPIARKGKLPAYQLAVVVDDAHQGVTEVLRGDDLLPSTARQWQLQRALALPHPTWVHVPLVTDAEGRRLAKRADDLSLDELRSGGTDPRAIVAWAAQTCGMPVSERVTPSQALAGFSLAGVPREPVKIDAATIAALREAR